MDESLIRTITNELRILQPNIQAGQMLSLYEEFAKLDTTVEQGIRAEWMDNVSAFYTLSATIRTNHQLLLNTESFFKKLLYVVDEDAYKSCISNPKLCLYYALEQLGMLANLPANIRLDSYDYTTLTNPIGRAVVQAYQLRNNASHTSVDWSLSQMIANVNAIMLATLHAVWKHRTIIQQRISTSTSNSQFGIDTLLKSVVKSYDRKIGAGFRYVPLLWESESNAQSKRMHIEELLEDKHILLSGEAGCGKTTSLDYLEYQAAKNYVNGSSNMIPVKIALINEVAESTLQEIICRTLNIPSAYCDSLLEKNGIYLLIDGLNELTADMERKKQFVISIEQFMSRYPNLFVVVSDRKYSPIPIHVKKTYHLKRMGKQDILNYANTRAECDKNVMNLLSQLLDEPSFTDVEYTPLLVNQLLLALASSGKIPSDLSELVGVYLDALLRREYIEKRDLNAAPGKLDIVLMKFAMADAGDNGISHLHAMKLCADIMREYGLQIQSDACITLAVQLGILKQAGSYIDFVLDDYRTYYLMKAIELGL